MKKTILSIEIVSSSNARLSSMGHQSRLAIYDTLSRHYSNVSITLIDSVQDLKNLARRKPDLVFLGMKFVPECTTDDLDKAKLIWIAEYLDAQGIAYTGSSQHAHTLELNKPLAKQRALDSSLRTAHFQVFHRDTSLDTPPKNPLIYPLFVKPTNRGGGLGIDSQSLVFNQEELQTKVTSIHERHQSDALVEEYLSGREFSVAILKNEDNNSYSAMSIELVAPEDINGTRMLSSDVKSADAELASHIQDSKTKQQIESLALAMFHALGARDYGRIDIRLDNQHIPHFLEANLLPSLIDNYGSFPKACLINKNLGYESMILIIVRLGLARRLPEPLPLVQEIDQNITILGQDYLPLPV